MKKPQQNNPLAEEPKDVTEQYSVVPTGQAVAGLYKALTCGERLASGQIQVGRGSNYEITTDGGRDFTLTITNAKEQRVSVSVSDIDYLTGNNKGIKKILLLTLTKINEQAVRGGQLTRDKISFSAKELVRLGIYTTLSSAKAGFDRAARALTAIQIGGTVATKGSDLGVDVMPLFRRATRGEVDPKTGRLRKKSLCWVLLNTELPVAFIIPYLTILPNYIYQLSNRGINLLRYISSQARQKQNLGKIVREGKPFTIGFLEIHRELCLPQVGGTDHPDRDIRQALGDAIEEVATQGRLFTREELTIRAKHKNGLSLKACSLEEYLAGGYIEIRITGSLLDGLKKVGGERRLSKKPKPKEPKQPAQAEPPTSAGQEATHPLIG